MREEKSAATDMERVMSGTDEATEDTRGSGATTDVECGICSG